MESAARRAARKIQDAEGALIEVVLGPLIDGEETSFMVRKSRVRLRYGSKRPGGNGRMAAGSPEQAADSGPARDRCVGSAMSASGA